MKSTELKEYLEKIIQEFGDLDVCVFRGDGTRVVENITLSRQGIDKDVSEQQVWIEI